jgi:hypothetical protein
MILAARTKNGIDIKENLSMLLNICWAKIVKGILPKKTIKKAAGRDRAMNMGRRLIRSSRVMIIKAINMLPS